MTDSLRVDSIARYAKYLVLVEPACCMLPLIKLNHGRLVRLVYCTADKHHWSMQQAQTKGCYGLSPHKNTRSTVLNGNLFRVTINHCTVHVHVCTFIYSLLSPLLNTLMSLIFSEYLDSSRVICQGNKEDVKYTSCVHFQEYAMYNREGPSITTAMCFNMC